jgi:hypothetical protein
LKGFAWIDGWHGSSSFFYLTSITRLRDVD